MKSISPKRFSMLSLEDFLDEIKISSAEDFEDESEEDALAFKVEDHLEDETNLWMDDPDFITSNPSPSDSSPKKTMASNINEAVKLV